MGVNSIRTTPQSSKSTVASMLLQNLVTLVQEEAWILLVSW